MIFYNLKFFCYLFQKSPQNQINHQNKLFRFFIKQKLFKTNNYIQQSTNKIVQVMRTKNAYSLSNSRRLSPLQSRHVSQNKMKRMKQVLNQINLIQKLRADASRPDQSIINNLKTCPKPVMLKTEDTELNNLNKQVSRQKRFSLQDSLKIKNSIRIRTQHQKRQHQQHRSLKKKQDLQFSTVQTLKSKNDIQLTPYEKQEAKIYEVLFIGERRIHSDSDFTNIQGYPIVKIQDSIKFRYQILSQLGHGAFGYVFKAFDHKRKQKVAIKIIKNHIRYQKQAKVQIKILESAILNDQAGNIQNIVQLKSAFLFRGHPCLVFQLLHMNLYQFCFQLNFVGLSLDLIRRFSIQILHALNFLQKNKIIHCDIKPQNIMIKRENKTGLKVIDFGSGCFDGQQIYNYVQSRYYRAPEIILGIQYGCPIDMWSFGCVCFQLFAGKPLFNGEDQENQIGLFVETLGIPPKKFLQQGNRYKKFFVIQENQIRMKQNIKGKMRPPYSKKIQKLLRRCSDQLFINFIAKCITWSPKDRMKASQALVHPWILAGIPQALRHDHQQSIKI